MKVSEAEGEELNWMVAKCKNTLWLYEGGVPGNCPGNAYTTDRELGGEIIEREHISVVWVGFYWCATSGNVAEIYRDDGGNYFQGIGKTPLLAAMRCYVISKLGENVEVPTL